MRKRVLVKMLKQPTGLRNGKPWPEIGETLQVNDFEVDALVRNRIAEVIPAPVEAPRPQRRKAQVETAKRSISTETATR